MHLWDLFYDINHFWDAGSPNPKMSYDCNDNEYVIEVEIPGIKKEKLSVKISKNILTVLGEDNKRKIDMDIRIFDDVNKDRINVKLENGILYITLPKVEESKAKEIKIN